MIFLFPTEKEAERLREVRPDLDIRICGVGAVECALAAQKVVAEGKDVLLCGIAGAYDSSLEKGDVVAVAEERFCRLSSGYNATYRATMVVEGLPTVVSNTVSHCAQGADGAALENMEGAMLFALCAEEGVRCGEIRSISNYVGEERAAWQIDLALENLTNFIAENF